MHSRWLESVISYELVHSRRREAVNSAFLVRSGRLGVFTLRPVEQEQENAVKGGEMGYKVKKFSIVNHKAKYYIHIC